MKSGENFADYAKKCGSCGPLRPRRMNKGFALAHKLKIVWASVGHTLAIPLIKAVALLVLAHSGPHKKWDVGQPRTA
jgi:hypothetical protein